LFFFPIILTCRFHVPGTEAEFYTFTSQLLITLKSLHSLGIVHNDLKLQNCLYDTKANKVTLIDFDLAEFHLPGSKWTSEALGTKKFQPPEMVYQRLLDHKGDIWRLGVMLAEIVNIYQEYILTNVVRFCNMFLRTMRRHLKFHNIHLNKYAMKIIGSE
jgi:casein kinase II subunit alpha